MYKLSTYSSGFAPRIIVTIYPNKMTAANCDFRQFSSNGFSLIKTKSKHCKHAHRAFRNESPGPDFNGSAASGVTI